MESRYQPVIFFDPSWGPPSIQTEPLRPNLLALIHKSFVEDVNVSDWSQLDMVVGTLWPGQRSQLMRHAPSRLHDQSWLESLQDLPLGHREPLYKFATPQGLCDAFLASNQYQSEASVAMLGTQSMSLLALHFFHLYILVSDLFYLIS